MNTSTFSGFTKLCKGFAVVLVAGHVVTQIIPSSVEYLALIPARTIPLVWNLLTAGYIEQTAYGMVISMVVLLFTGKVLEPVWGSKEFFKFVFVVNLLTFACVFTVQITMYYVTWSESHLYTSMSGFQGVLLGFLVGLKQIVPDQEMPLLKIKAKWAPSLVLVLLIALSSIAPELAAVYLPTSFYGAYTSWLYLRFLQRKPETKVKGDPSGEFAFSTFFPELLRPFIEPVVSVFSRALCGRPNTPDDVGGNHVFRADALPGSDPAEASRRRERGARALEERLALEAKKAERDAANNV